MTAVKKTCFVLMPFAQEFGELYQAAIRPSIETVGMTAIRADTIHSPGSISEEIYRQIGKADAIVAIISRSNPHVFYELGIAHTIGKPVILASDEIEKVPFDLRSLNVILYEVTPSGVVKLRSRLEQALTQLLEIDPFTVLSPVSEALADLDLIPRSELISVKSELETARERLVETEQQLKSLSKDPSVGSVLEGQEDLKAFFIETIEKLAMPTERNLARTKLELEQLREQRVQDQAAINELRELKRKMVVNPHWSGRDFAVEDDLVFLLMPFREPWSDALWKLIDRVVRQNGFRCERADEKDGRVVMEDIWEGVNKARLIIADLTSKNPNVTYEVGVADVLGKVVMLLSQTPEDVPFDFLGIRLITYENDIAGVEKLTDALSARLGHLKSD